MPGEKTEPPTAKKLRDAREEGQVAKSQEIPATSVVLAVFGYVWFAFDWIRERVGALFEQCLALANQPFDDAFKPAVVAAFGTFALLVLPVVLLAATAGLLGHWGQTGVLFAWKAATPKFDKLNPLNWFKKVFSLKNLLEFGRSLVKIAVICLVFYQVFMGAVPEMARAPNHGTAGVDALLKTVMWSVALYAGLAFVAIAAVDWLLQRLLFLREHRMSKEDIKNEYKQQEGDPHAKAARKRLAREIAFADDPAQLVRRASVLITNPTHLAIALEYEQGRTPLPIILLKGQGNLAERMMKVAEEEGIPIMRDVSLAHELWEDGEEFDFIPERLIKPVAEVLRWLRELEDQANGGSAP